MKKSWLLGVAALGFALLQTINADAAAKITYKEYQLGENIKITVPYVEGMENKTSENALNKRFLDSAKDYLIDNSENENPLTNDRFDFRSNYEIAYNDFEFLSVVQWYYVYNGGAHGNTYFKTTTYNTETGKFLEMKDLFKEGVDYQTLLTDLVKEEISARGAKAEGFYFEKVDDNTLFYLTKSGLVMLFSPYAIAPYVAGDVRVHIPWWKIQDQMREEIPVW